LVERLRNPNDRPSYLIRLTSQGKQTQLQAAAGLAEKADTLLKSLNLAKRRQLIDLLTRVADHWEELTRRGRPKRTVGPRRRFAL
jgi:DNA-binding MarR family transcriptional regulator